MNESALLYESIAASRWFAKAAFVLLCAHFSYLFSFPSLIDLLPASRSLNKLDLFTVRLSLLSSLPLTYLPSPPLFTNLSTQEKILSPSPRSRLALYHPDFTGPPQDLSAAKGYMRKRFEELDKRRGGGGSTLGGGGGGAAGVGGGRQSYTHFTCVRLFSYSTSFSCSDDG